MAFPLHPFRALKTILPRRLFGRSLLIIITPMILLQAIVTSVFFDRHYRIVTAIMTRGVANDIGYMAMLENRLNPGPQRDRERAHAASLFGFGAEFFEGQRVEQPTNAPETVLDRQLDYIFTTSIGQDTAFDTSRSPDSVDLRVQVNGGVLRVRIPRDRVTAANADMFLLWMLGSSFILLLIAVVFLRNQIKPIEELASAAESLGKGRAVENFKPHGATEVRRAAQAFLLMRERIDRHVQQRTEMLAGVSHDLRTPLTRMRLQLAMMPKDADTEAMASDVLEMERMVNEYLAFAKGEGGESIEPVELASLIQECIADTKRARGRETITAALNPDVVLPVKRQAMKRCIVNLIDNAVKYGKRVEVSLVRGPRHATINVDDDGPGIEADRHEEAFRPFRRLDESRNLQMGGVGLGLAIARDIARAAGGDVTLEKSALGGLRASVRLPL